MGINERKERDKELLQKSILTAAREVFLEKGFDQTSIRSIAQRIEYSPTTIYLYFKDKDAILFALHSEGFQLLGSKLEVLYSVENPYERLKAMGRIYLQFAADYPDYYDLMFVQKSPLSNLEDDELWKEGASSFEGLKATVQQCMDQGYLPFLDAEAGAYLVWSAMHGMCNLYDRGRCKVLDPEKSEKIVDMGFDEFIRMMDSFKI
ncbi:TetR/AcrR family transcriptional regulator [Fluviicola taffensis]|uniref:Transcriptional regulator, TetR family n=1 Tax=Fluviicola taffensis (strain DSM 16823 / NCIMB 13979 / RW262) TaxID=755732 RepID=F2IEK3_FLUTR|nr:TetR/AcrR family transcriptional regulator [Fluviicola taffensis]AEA44542.1 transcriptional regulator, TetR family [Fluviicola taffensis DSM 16823]